MFNPQDIQQAGHAFATGFSQAISSSFSDPNVTDRISSTVSELAKNIFNNIISNASSSADLGQSIGNKFAEFAKNAMKGTGFSGSGAGSQVGGGVNEFLRNLVKDIEMKTVTGDFMKEISDAFKSGVKNVDMKGNMETLASEFDAGMGVFRENLYKQLDSLRGDVQSLFSNMARDMTLKTLPWLALGGVVMMGTPLLTWYIYKKAVYNLGRPELAQKVRKVGVVDRTTDGISRAVSTLWSSTKIGLKWSALVGGAGLTLTIVGGTASAIMSGGDPGYLGRVFEGVACLLFGNRYCSTADALPFVALTVGAGALRGTSHLARSFFDFMKKAISKDEKPVFSEELQRRIDELTAATYNINKNGGFMQNLLLYGPGGTGKTMISEYIATNSNMNYVMMSGGDLAQYIKRGEHVTELNKIFEDAKNSYSPTILFIDECESLCGDRGKMDKSELIELINCFLNHTGVPSKKVMIILTTNRKDDLDPAVLNRMDNKLYIGPPEQAERKKIIETYLPTFMTKSERTELFTESVISQIANQTEGFTGRTIFKMFNAMSSKRASTKDNKLTLQMVQDTVSDYVKQEIQVAVKADTKMRQPEVTGPVTTLAEEEVEVESSRTKYTTTSETPTKMRYSNRSKNRPNLQSNLIRA